MNEKDKDQKLKDEIFKMVHKNRELLEKRGSYENMTEKEIKKVHQKSYVAEKALDYLEKKYKSKQ